MNDIVSIIMPSYNSELYIEETIKSIIAQIYKKWELIIVDDASIDSTTDIIKKYSKYDQRIKLIRLNSNHGQAYARNIGIKYSSGRYLSFIDSDDLWENNFLQVCIDFMKENKYELVFSKFNRMDENLKESFGILKCKKEVRFSDLLKNNYLSCLSTIIDIKRIGKVYFDENYNHEDHIYWLNILNNKINCAYGIDKNLAIYRIRKNSTSRNKIRAAKWKWTIYRKYLKFSLFKSLYYYMFYIVYGFKKNSKFIFYIRKEV